MNSRPGSFSRAFWPGLFYCVVLIGPLIQAVERTRGSALPTILVVATVVSLFQTLALLAFYRPLVGRPMPGSRLLFLASAWGFFFLVVFVARGIVLGVDAVRHVLGSRGSV